MKIEISKVSPEFFQKILKKKFIYSLIYGVLNQILRPDEIGKISIRFSLDLLKKNFGKNSKVVMTNVFTPTELFFALDTFPILPEVASAVSANFGISNSTLFESDEILFSKDSCSVHRNLIGLIKMGFLPKPTYIVSTDKPCHSAIHSFYLISKIFGGEYFVIDIPEDNSEESINYLSKKLSDLFFYLAKEFKVKNPIKNLEKAIEFSNEARKYLIEINDLRKRKVLIDGRKFLGYLGMIFSAFGSEYGRDFFKLLRDKLKILYEEGYEIKVKRRIFWMHLGPYFKVDLFDFLNNKGAYIVFEETSNVYWDEFDKHDPFISIAKKLINYKIFSNLDERFRTAIKFIEEYKIDGVVIFNQWGCRQGAGSSYLLRKKLINFGIPTIIIDGDLVDETNYPKEQIKTRVEGFLEVLG
ncbi:MAG: 2-hydroxyacyl-CoA dehydratase family protein [Caldisericia bacterium]|nr:2-hydroxyacyl-CoA dehydratase family protein [Caldisericia bacterium]